MKLALFVCLIAAAMSAAFAANWAIVVAGSSGYTNYRHQADTADMWQILKMNGIPESNIISMLYDDVANSPSNPKKGQLFNWPGGPDVYQGMVKDYTAGDVTAVNFLKIMKGEDMTGIGSVKTLKSTSEDRVFIAFFDHGAPGLIAFPNDVLHSNDLNDALNSMYQKGMFKELVFYMEACESGSMFNGILDPKIKVYAMTAADPSESSWACDYDSSVQTYLNDCFSRNHMLDTRAHDTGSYTLKQQYESVLASTTKSHVCLYGDMSYQDEDIALFFGKKSSSVHVPNTDSAVNSRNVALATLEQRMKTATEEEASTLRAEYERHQTLRDDADMLFANLRSFFPAKEFTPSNDACTQSSELDTTCMKSAVDAFVKRCGMPNEYMLEHFKHIARFCNARLNVAEFEASLKTLC